YDSEADAKLAALTPAKVREAFWEDDPALTDWDYILDGILLACEPDYRGYDDVTVVPGFRTTATQELYEQSIARRMGSPVVTTPVIQCNECDRAFASEAAKQDHFRAKHFGS